MKLPIKGSGKVISDDKGILSIHYSNFSESKGEYSIFKCLHINMYIIFCKFTNALRKIK